MASRSGRQEETGDRSRESRREADGHIDDFVSSPVGRRSPTEHHTGQTLSPQQFSTLTGFPNFLLLQGIEKSDFSGHQFGVQKPQAKTGPATEGLPSMAPATTHTNGKEVFLSCVVLQEVVTPTELSDIGNRAFCGCEQLQRFAPWIGVISSKGASKQKVP